jgi:hypothetical protein
MTTSCTSALPKQPLPIYRPILRRVATRGLYNMAKEASRIEKVAGVHKEGMRNVVTASYKLIGRVSLEYRRRSHHSTPEKLAHSAESITTSFQSTLEEFVLSSMFNLRPPNRFDRIIGRFANWTFASSVCTVNSTCTVQAPLMEGVFAHEMHCG